AAGLQIVRGVDREHFRHRARRLDVDAADHAMRVGAAHDHAVGLTGYVEIVAVMAIAAHEDRIFGARHRLADREALLGAQNAGIDSVVHASPRYWPQTISPAASVP